MVKKSMVLAAAIAAMSMVATGAEAHTGVGQTSGFASGLWHPLGGLDHILAMVAVGVIAAQIGGRALWMVPSAFVGLMVVGAAMALSGLGLPYVEAGIGLSVLVFGAVLATGVTLPAALAAALVGAFAIFHGHAHGSEIGETASGLEYGAGFVVATALLHLAGIGLGLAIGRQGRTGLVRLAGAATAMAGVAILAGFA